MHDLCRTADVVAVARISYVPQQPQGTTVLPPVDAEVLEFIREGDAKKGSIRFLSHRHGSEQYVVGEELLLFLERTTSPEKAKEAPYETIEAVGDRFVLPAARRDVWINAARKYAALGKGLKNATDPRALGLVSMAMLSGPDVHLAELALRDVTLAGTAPVLTADDLTTVLHIVDDASRPAMLRVGLLSELERRKLVVVGSRWVKLLDSTAANERSAVISGAKSRWFVPEVNAALIAIVGRDKPDEAIAAARAVGNEGNEAAVDVLVGAATKEPAELRFAVMNSLRRINTAKSRDKLASFAASHPDAETRKVAATEIGLLAPTPVEPKGKKEEQVAITITRSSFRTMWFTIGVILMAIVVAAGALWGRGKKPLS